MVVGLSAIAAFAGTGQVGKALMMTILGLILATVGENTMFNGARVTGGIMDLQSGIGFITLMGAYIGPKNATEWLLLVAIGFVATILRFADYPLAPLLIGFILGPMLEDNFARSMQLYDGAASSSSDQ